jgi:hypothetical protein
MVMNKLYIISLEPIESRYTWYWKDSLYYHFKNYLIKNNLNYDVENVEGDEISTESTNGAFLNFSQTNIWKNTQINKICRFFSENKIISGDKFLFTDAWHPGILQVKYMSELLDINVDIYNLWHAGSYDPQDFLGRKIQDKKWSYSAESAFFFAADKNFFATTYHKDLFTTEILEEKKSRKAVVTGFPFEYIKGLRELYSEHVKEDIILFPHRVSVEKQPEIFRDLSNKFGHKYKFIVCQDKKLSKQEYYYLLNKSKIVFSANLQETLGISCYEGAIFGSIPLVPDRLSYTEMYSDEFKYPSEYTQNFLYYQSNSEKLIGKIDDIMTNYENYKSKLPSLLKKLDNFFSMDEMIKEIFER